jgi:hypothetical protein
MGVAPAVLALAAKGVPQVAIPPVVHQAARDGFRALVPRDGARLRQSPDGLFHPCIAPAMGGYRDAPQMLCLYVPDLGA